LAVGCREGERRRSEANEKKKKKKQDREKKRRSQTTDNISGNWKYVHRFTDNDFLQPQPLGPSLPTAPTH
jgi:hypothetical protein